MIIIVELEIQFFVYVLTLGSCEEIVLKSATQFIWSDIRHECNVNNVNCACQNFHSVMSVALLN